MALGFVPSYAGLLLVQASMVAAPKASSQIKALRRFHGRGWALVPIASIVLVIFAIRFVPDTATGLTWLALIAVPPLAATTLAWAMRGATPLAALAVLPLFVVAWAARGSLAAQAAEVILEGLSCVTLGVLLAAITPSSWLKVGILLMAAADVWLVAAHLLQAPNAKLGAAAPPASLPQLQEAVFGSAIMGYGDLFIAAVLGAVLADRLRVQLSAALLTLVLASLFGLLFFFLNSLPATVPVAVAMICVELWDWRRRRAESRALLEHAPAVRA
jgi:hypothetical protein